MFYRDDLKRAWQENLRRKRNRTTMNVKLYLKGDGGDAVNKN